MQYKKDFTQIKLMIEQMKTIQKSQGILLSDKLELSKMRKYDDHITYVCNEINRMEKIRDMIFNKYEKKALLNIAKQQDDLIKLFDKLILITELNTNITNTEIKILQRLNSMMDKLKKHDKCQEC